MDVPEPSRAGTRNSGQFGRSLTISGHVRERSRGSLASSPAARRSYRRWSGFRSRLPSCCRRATVSDSGEIANRVAANYLDVVQLGRERSVVVLESQRVPFVVQL